ncbi:hypothetical protein MKJ04_10630 [Pontibacter sp. E15-1]|uniref:hypothetical protein n=1 Tax=Pontibacter sp. E15-1 TaxID=2919918 RepID=UPI001F4F834A|nr:hypothetical protein [Pontibacter sp. E15-1]MCJ8165299.1 hypothetical protein [Pontibacter sp. E15-1]
MKKALPLLLMLFLFASCNKNNPIPIWHTYINSSGYDVVLKRKGDPDITLKNGEKKEVAIYKYGAHDIVPAVATTRTFEFKGNAATPGIFHIISYEYRVEYAVEGTAGRADITIHDEFGKAQTFKNVSLPVRYQFKDFCKCTAYVSATRVSGAGYLTATLFRKGSLFNQAVSQDDRPATVVSYE